MTLRYSAYTPYIVLICSWIALPRSMHVNQREGSCFMLFHSSQIQGLNGFLISRHFDLLFILFLQGKPRFELGPPTGPFGTKVRTGLFYHLPFFLTPLWCGERRY